jgi:hypothetical protein
MGAAVGCCADHFRQVQSLYGLSGDVHLRVGRSSNEVDRARRGPYSSNEVIYLWVVGTVVEAKNWLSLLSVWQNCTIWLTSLRAGLIVSSSPTDPAAPFFDRDQVTAFRHGRPASGWFSNELEESYLTIHETPPMSGASLLELIEAPVSPSLPGDFWDIAACQEGSAPALTSWVVFAPPMRPRPGWRWHASRGALFGWPWTRCPSSTSLARRSPLPTWRQPVLRRLPRPGCCWRASPDSQPWVSQYRRWKKRWKVRWTCPQSPQGPRPLPPPPLLLQWRTCPPPSPYSSP